MHSQSQSSAVRYALGGLLAFGALNAFAGGYYGCPAPTVSLLNGCTEVRSTTTRFQA
jgi:hypothetical protein